MQNYRIHKKTGPSRRKHSTSGVGKIIIFAVIIILVFIGVRVLLSGSNNTDSPESDDIQTLESLLENVNVPLDTGEEETALALGGSSATVCEAAFSSIDTEDKIVALTFDSGGIVTHADQILETLKSENVPATFFLTGEFAAEHPDIVKKISESGFPIGNHSDTHTSFLQLTSDGIIEEVSLAKEKIEADGSITEVPFVRPPFGSYNSSVTETLAGEGFCTALWSIDAEDWKTESTADTVVARVNDNLSPGDIVMMQFGHETIAEALPQVIQKVRDAGYTFVDLTRYYAPSTETSPSSDQSTP